MTTDAAAIQTIYPPTVREPYRDDARVKLQGDARQFAAEIVKRSATNSTRKCGICRVA